MLVRRAANRHGTADTITIQAEILGTGRGDQHFRHTRSHHPQIGRILGQPVPEPLIGDIDKGHDALVQNEIGQRIPVIRAKIGPCRIMATAMQQQHVTRLHALNILHHGGRIHSAGSSVEITVFRQLQAHMTRHADM